MKDVIRIAVQKAARAPEQQSQAAHFDDGRINPSHSEGTYESWQLSTTSRSQEEAVCCS